ncbi:MAG: hypothetical protein DELT_01127 [Desulfovibrio sp.]
MKLRHAVLVALFLFVPLPAFGGDAALPPVAPPTITQLGEAMQATFGADRPKQWGEAIQGVVTRLTASPEGEKRVALTLDACEGVTDMRIVALLRKHTIPATIFVTNRWLRANPKVAADLAADPLFTFACHGKRHKPASVNGKLAFGIRGTRSVPALVEEVEDNARAIAELTGKRPTWYRSGTAFYDDVAVRVITELGLRIAGYTVSADAGATLPAAKVARLLVAAPDGAIILCHINHPESGTYAGLAKAVPVMLEKGVRFVPLEEAEK